MTISGRFLNNTKAKMTFWIHGFGYQRHTVTLKISPNQVPPGKSEQPPGKRPARVRRRGGAEGRSAQVWSLRRRPD